MLKSCFVACALALAVVLAGQNAQAAQLSASGFVTGPTDANTPFSFVLSYVPSTGTAVAAVNGGTLTLGSQVWNTVLGGTGASITTVTPIGQTKANSLQVAVQFSGPASPGPNTGTAVTFLSFTINGPGLDSSASEANISNIRSFANSGSGTLFISPSAPFGSNSLVLQGVFQAVPEPASIGLLCGLGAVVGLNRYRRARRTAVTA